MLTEDDFNPPDDRFEQEKNANIASNAKMISRRKVLEPWIAKIKDAILNAFGGRLQPEQAQVALTVLYDMVYKRVSNAIHQSPQEAEQWLRVARDIVAIDEYAIMESMYDLVDHNFTQDRSKVESLYNSFLSGAKKDAASQSAVFIEIGFALVMIIEEEAEADGDTVEAYFNIKEDLDRKYGPMFTGLEMQYRDAIQNRRSYGRPVKSAA